MKNKKIVIGALVIAALALTGCGKENAASVSENKPTSAVNVQDNEKTIGFPESGVSVDSITVNFDEITFTDEMSEKICSMMSDVTYLDREIDHAVLAYITVNFSDGSSLSVDGYENIGAYKKSSDARIELVNVPDELEEYLLALDPENSPSATATSAEEENNDYSIGFPEEDVSVEAISILTHEANEPYEWHELPLTDEVSEKVCSMMSDVTYLKDELELAIEEYLTVQFSDGSRLAISDYETYGFYTNSDKTKSGLANVPGELRSYLLGLASEAEADVSEEAAE